jgi:hypothetical protein
MPVGKPAIVTPNRVPDAATLRLWQQTIDNVRERFQAVEAAFLLFQTTELARDSGTASALTSIRARLTALETALASLPTSLISTEPADDGDVLTWSDDAGQYVPEAPAPSPSSGGILPLVTGEVPPVFVYLDDGSLVYGAVEA